MITLLTRRSPARIAQMADPTAPPGPQPGLRTAREVIDAAIRENRQWEWVSLGLTVGFAAVGLVVLGVGTYQGSGPVALAGSVTAALFWPALRNAVAIRRENIRIRLFEIPLALAQTSAQAAEAVRQATAGGPKQEKPRDANPGP
jgi:hypothetical protein